MTDDTVETIRLYSRITQLESDVTHLYRALTITFIALIVVVAVNLIGIVWRFV